MNEVLWKIISAHRKIFYAKESIGGDYMISADRPMKQDV
jgi:hypothetical protein